MSKEIELLLGKLKDAHIKSAELTEELEKSLAIKELWPDAFKHGEVTSTLLGKSGKDNDQFVVISNLKESITCSLKDFPYLLLEHLLTNRIDSAPTMRDQRFWRQLKNSLKAKEKKS